jgi:hypothetical protein
MRFLRFALLVLLFAGTAPAELPKPTIAETRVAGAALRGRLALARLRSSCMAARISLMPIYCPNSTGSPTS